VTTRRSGGLHWRPEQCSTDTGSRGPRGNNDVVRLHVSERFFPYEHLANIVGNQCVRADGVDNLLKLPATMGLKIRFKHYDLLALAESTMTITPGELLETSIAQVRTLVAFLGEQLDESAGGDTAQSSTLEVRACKDMLVSLTVLLQHSRRSDRIQEIPEARVLSGRRTR